MTDNQHEVRSWRCAVFVLPAQPVFSFCLRACLQALLWCRHINYSQKVLANERVLACFYVVRVSRTWRNRVKNVITRPGAIERQRPNGRKTNATSDTPDWDGGTRQTHDRDKTDNWSRRDSGNREWRVSENAAWWSRTLTLSRWCKEVTSESQIWPTGFLHCFYTGR